MENIFLVLWERTHLVESHISDSPDFVSAPHNGVSRPNPDWCETFQKTQHRSGSQVLTIYTGCPKSFKNLWSVFWGHPVTPRLRQNNKIVFCRRMSLTGHSDHPSQLFNGSNSGSRRGSIQDSLIQFSKNFKIGSAGQSSRCVSELGRFLSRTTLQAVLANHLGDKKIKVELIWIFNKEREKKNFCWCQLLCRDDREAIWLLLCSMSDEIMSPVHSSLACLQDNMHWTSFHLFSQFLSCPLIVTQH